MQGRISIAALMLVTADYSPAAAVINPNPIFLAISEFRIGLRLIDRPKHCNIKFFVFVTNENK